MYLGNIMPTAALGRGGAKTFAGARAALRELAAPRDGRGVAVRFVVRALALVRARRGGRGHRDRRGRRERGLARVEHGLARGEPLGPRGDVALARARALPIVIDADGLHLVTERPGVIAGYERAVLLEWLTHNATSPMTNKQMSDTLREDKHTTAVATPW